MPGPQRSENHLENSKKQSGDDVRVQASFETDADRLWRS